jgi:ERCC4-type nuclease
VEKAARLLDHFGSVQSVINASFEELQQVKGIGENLARSIRDLLEPDPPEFSEGKP